MAVKMFAAEDVPCGTSCPELILIAAVLKRAVSDYVSSYDRLAKEAEDWIFNEEDPSAQIAFSFQWVCEQLGISPQRIKDAVKQLKEHGGQLPAGLVEAA